MTQIGYYFREINLVLFKSLVPLINIAILINLQLKLIINELNLLLIKLGLLEHLFEQPKVYK